MHNTTDIATLQKAFGTYWPASTGKDWLARLADVRGLLEGTTSEQRVYLGNNPDEFIGDDFTDEGELEERVDILMYVVTMHAAASETFRLLDILIG